MLLCLVWFLSISFLCQYLIDKYTTVLPKKWIGVGGAMRMVGRLLQHSKYEERWVMGCSAKGFSHSLSWIALTGGQALGPPHGVCTVSGNEWSHTLQCLVSFIRLLSVSSARIRDFMGAEFCLPTSSQWWETSACDRWLFITYWNIKIKTRYKWNTNVWSHKVSEVEISWRSFNNVIGNTLQWESSKGN